MYKNDELVLCTTIHTLNRLYIANTIIDEIRPEMISSMSDFVSFLPRGFVEYNPVFKQIIPYVVVTDGTNFLAYTRSDEGGENRLHHKMSIGVGGHININDKGEDILDTICAAAKRELLEETQIDADISMDDVMFYINDTSDPVGQVHLGIVFIKTLDHDILNSAAYCTKCSELKSMSLYDSEYLISEAVTSNIESWSDILIQKML